MDRGIEDFQIPVRIRISGIMDPDLTSNISFLVHSQVDFCWHWCQNSERDESGNIFACFFDTCQKRQRCRNHHRHPSLDRGTYPNRLNFWNFASDWKFHRPESASKNSIRSIRRRYTSLRPFQPRQWCAHSSLTSVSLTKALVYLHISVQTCTQRALNPYPEANPNGHQESDSTPLHVAAERGDADIVKTLLELGADQSIRNTRGQLPRGTNATWKLTALTFFDQRWHSTPWRRSLAKMRRFLIISSEALKLP